MTKSLVALALVLSGCTATFIGDRAYQSVDPEPPPSDEPIGRSARDMEVVEPPAQLVFHEPVEATKQRFHELAARRPTTGSKRPRQFASAPAIRFAPPILSAEGPTWPGGGLGWLTLKQAGTGVSLTIFPELTAEVILTSRYYTSGPVPGAELRGPQLWDKLGACESHRAASTVNWNGFLSKTRTSQSLEYFEMKGLLSPKTCRAEASEVRSVTAAAVLPGVIYAARRCVDGACLTSAPQSIILIGPPAKWMPSTTGQPAELLVPHTGSFSRAEVSIRKGGSGSALFTVDAEHIAKFRGTPNPSVFIGVKTVVISVDILWPSTAEEPTFSVQIAAVDEEPEGFGEKAERSLSDPSSGYTFIDDALQPDSFPDPRTPAARRR